MGGASHSSGFNGAPLFGAMEEPRWSEVNASFNSATRQRHTTDSALVQELALICKRMNYIEMVLKILKVNKKRIFIVGFYADLTVYNILKSPYLIQAINI